MSTPLPHTYWKWAVEVKSEEEGQSLPETHHKFKQALCLVSTQVTASASPPK